MYMIAWGTFGAQLAILWDYPSEMMTLSDAVYAYFGLMYMILTGYRLGPPSALNHESPAENLPSWGLILILKPQAPV